MFHSSDLHPRPPLSSRAMPILATPSAYIQSVIVHPYQTGPTMPSPAISAPRCLVISPFVCGLPPTAVSYVPFAEPSLVCDKFLAIQPHVTEFKQINMLALVLLCFFNLRRKFLTSWLRQRHFHLRLDLPFCEQSPFFLFWRKAYFTGVNHENVPSQFI